MKERSPSGFWRHVAMQHVPHAAMLPHERSDTHRARLRYHGLLIFLGQIALILLVPLFDSGQRLTPGAYVVVGMTISVASVLLLGYRRLAIVLTALGTAACLWATFHIVTARGVRLLPMTLFLAIYLISVVLSIRQAFKSGVTGTQRIFCGAASFIMLGFFFTAVHAMIGMFEFASYVLPKELEGDRMVRWADFILLSFSTLTTSGFSDISPIGSFPLMIATLEGLSAILFPATLIARIASLPSDDPG